MQTYLALIAHVSLVELYIYIYKFNGYRTRLAIMEDNGKKVVLLQRIWHKNESRCNCVCVCVACASKGTRDVELDK